MKVLVFTGAPFGFLAVVRIFISGAARSADPGVYPMEVEVPRATEADLEKMRSWAPKVEKVSD